MPAHDGRIVNVESRVLSAGLRSAYGLRAAEGNRAKALAGRYARRRHSPCTGADGKIRLTDARIEREGHWRQRRSGEG